MPASSAIADLLPARPAQAQPVARNDVHDGRFSQVLAETRNTASPASAERANPSRQENLREKAQDKVRENRAAASPDSDAKAPARRGRSEDAREDQPMRESRRERHDDGVHGADQPQRSTQEGPAGSEAASSAAKSAESTGSVSQSEPASDSADKSAEATETPALTPDAGASPQPAQMAVVQPSVGQVLDAALALTADGTADAAAAPDAAQEQQTALAQTGTAAGVNGNVAGAAGVLAGNPTADVSPQDKTAITVGASAIPVPGPTAPGSAPAVDAAPVKPEEASKAAVRTEATQGFAAQLAQLASAKTDAQAAEGAKLSPDGVQALAAPQGSATSGTASPAVATPQQAMARADAPVPLQALAVEVGMRAMRGAKEFAIRLDPEDLGRVDIRLEISEKGEVQAKLTVERVETLQLLQRDARTLERAFDQAGLKTNPDGLQFSLRDPGQQNQQNGRGSDGTPRQGRGEGGPGDDALPALKAVYRAPSLGALDIRI